MSKVERIIDLWKEKKIDIAKFEYDCGGDSMGNTELTFYDINGIAITEDVTEIEEYINTEIYNKVDFYVNSDGHYIGEAGVVDITLGDAEDDFEYEKTSEYEYNEGYGTDMEYHLTPEQKAFIEAHVLNINGGDGTNCTVNYKHDFLMTDEDEELVEELKRGIEQACQDYRPSDDYEGSLTEWYNYTTNRQGSEIKFKGDMLIIHMTNTVVVFRDE